MTTMLHIDTAPDLGPSATSRGPVRATCAPGCRPAPAHRAHHDRLLCVEHDADAVLDLMELALTWYELEYDPSTLLGPEQWTGLVAAHHWADADRVERIFGLALDVAARSRPALRMVGPAA